MYIDELINYFKSLEIKDLSIEEYKDYAYKCFNYYAENNPHISLNFDDIKKTYAIKDVTEKILDFWSQDKKTINPIYNKKNEEIAKHEFFKNRKYVCAAPYTTLKFEIDGKMTVCCNNKDYPIGIYPNQTPYEAWNGEKIKDIRNALSKKDFSKGCGQCAKSILAGNGHNTILAVHDKIVPNVENYFSNEWPIYMIFQHQNTCNYECVMCGGDFSSLIARNREKRPLTNNPYNNSEFLSHIEPFLPHVKVFEFLGGEPFLINQNYKIWEMIKKVNPNAVVDIISNGSIYNSKIEELLIGLPNSSVHISIDTISPEIYSYIRRNGNLQNVKINILKLKKIKRMGGLSVCPMIQNIRDIPNVIKYCERMDLDITFNDVQYALGLMYEDTHENGNVKRQVPLTDSEKPKELIKEFRLWKLPKEELQKHIEFLEFFDCPIRYQPRYYSFINYLKNYVAELN